MEPTSSHGEGIQLISQQPRETRVSAVSDPGPIVGDARERLAEVSRLATLLADQVLNAQIMKRPVPDGHIRSLLTDALVIKEHGQELPSLLGQIMHGISEERPIDPNGAQQNGSEDEEAGRLAWMFLPFQGTKG